MKFSLKNKQLLSTCINKCIKRYNNFILNLIISSYISPTVFLGFFVQLRIFPQEHTECNITSVCTTSDCYSNKANRIVVLVS